MTSTVFLGVLLAVVAGLMTGISPWPVKRMRQFQYEHWAFVAMLTGLILTPWLVTLLWCPDAMEAYQSLGYGPLLKSNLCSLSWGIANVLWLLCFVRIGMSLANGILTGIGASLGVVTPMVIKGTGAFADAPELLSPAGCTVLGGVVMMLLGVVMVSRAGLARERAIVQTGQPRSAGFIVGLLMAGLAGILSTGISFAFVYSQSPIIEAMKIRHAADIPANVAVWAAGLSAGASLNVLYPVYSMTKQKSWHVLWRNPGEIVLAVLFGVPFFASFVLMGQGMVLMGPLGASIGLGLQQTTFMLGGQAVGFYGGEWKGVAEQPRVQMYYAIAVLITAAIIMACGNALVAR